MGIDRRIFREFYVEFESWEGRNIYNIAYFAF